MLYPLSYAPVIAGYRWGSYLHPRGAPTRAIGRALPLCHDALKPQPAGVLEYHCPVALNMLREAQSRRCLPEQSREAFAPLDQGSAFQILTVDREHVEN